MTYASHQAEPGHVSPSEAGLFYCIEIVAETSSLPYKQKSERLREISQPLACLFLMYIILRLSQEASLSALPVNSRDRISLPSALT